MKICGKAEEAVENIVKAFRNPATLPAPLAQVFVQQKDGSPCRKWSWRNQLIVAVRGHREARGFRQWEQVGRKVKKGEKAFYILSPVVKEVEDEEGNKQKIVYGFRGTAVFGYEQTEGEPLATFGPSSWIESLPLIEVAKGWGLWVDAIQGDGNVLGSYCVGKGIALRVRNLSTWAHELVHAADDRNGKLNGSPKWQKEVVAELGGAVLLCALGFEHAADLGGCWEYIQNYANERQVEVIDICSEVLERTCEAVSQILDTAEQIQAEMEKVGA
jgi:hypothetical protein